MTDLFYKIDFTGKWMTERDKYMKSSSEKKGWKRLYNIGDTTVVVFNNGEIFNLNKPSHSVINQLVNSESENETKLIISEDFDLDDYLCKKYNLPNLHFKQNRVAFIECFEKYNLNIISKEEYEVRTEFLKKIRNFTISISYLYITKEGLLVATTEDKSSIIYSDFDSTLNLWKRAERLKLDMKKFIIYNDKFKACEENESNSIFNSKAIYDEFHKGNYLINEYGNFIKLDEVNNIEIYISTQHIDEFMKKPDKSKLCFIRVEEWIKKISYISQGAWINTSFVVKNEKEFDTALIAKCLDEIKEEQAVYPGGESMLYDVNQTVVTYTYNGI